MGFFKNRKAIKSQVKSQNLKWQAEQKCAESAALEDEYQRSCVHGKDLNIYALDQCDIMKAQRKPLAESCYKKTKEYEHTPVSYGYSRSEFKKFGGEQRAQLAEVAKQEGIRKQRAEERKVETELFEMAGQFPDTAKESLSQDIAETKKVMKEQAEERSKFYMKKAKEKESPLEETKSKKS